MVWLSEKHGRGFTTTCDNCCIGMSGSALE